MAIEMGYTSDQLQRLEELFVECKFPNKEQREKWSRDIGMDPYEIKRWFKNKRLLVEIEEKRRENDVLRRENDIIQMENFIMKEKLENLPNCNTCLRTENRASLLRENTILREEHRRQANILVGILQSPALVQFRGQDREPDVDLELGLAPSGSSGQFDDINNYYED